MVSIEPNWNVRYKSKDVNEDIMRAINFIGEKVTPSD